MTRAGLITTGIAEHPDAGGSRLRAINEISAAARYNLFLTDDPPGA